MYTTLNFGRRPKDAGTAEKEVRTRAMGLNTSSSLPRLWCTYLPLDFAVKAGLIDAVGSWKKKKRIEGWRLARVATLQILLVVVVVAITDHLWSYTDRWGQIQSIGFGNFEAAKSSLFSKY